MLPISEFDKIECLESLVGIRSQCAVDASYPFWIEDIEGVEVKKLAMIAKASNGSGKDFGNQLINSAAREMMGHLELLMNNGYKLKEVAADMCSSCSLLPSYTANGGIIVKSVLPSNFKELKLTKLVSMTNVTGDHQITIDDGVLPKYYTGSFTSGVLQTFNINYTTREKSVRVYFTDPLVPGGLVSCPTSSSCGCGKSNNSDNVIVVTGLAGGLESSTQIGFIPCASITCSTDLLVCNLIKQLPNIFGLTLFYKVGEKYLLHKAASERNNEAVSYNEEEPSELVRNYSRLYTSLLYGTVSQSGVKKVINDFLSQKRSDSCVMCESKIKTAYVTG